MTKLSNKGFEKIKRAWRQIQSKCWDQWEFYDKTKNKSSKNEIDSDEALEKNDEFMKEEMQAKGTSDNEDEGDSSLKFVKDHQSKQSCNTILMPTMLEIKKKCSLNITLLNVLPYELWLQNDYEKSKKWSW